MQRVEGLEEASSPATSVADIVDACADEVPFGGVGLLVVAEDVQLVMAGEAFDEPDEGGDHALFA
jgi:hypothetical protein